MKKLLKILTILPFAFLTNIFGACCGDEFSAAEDFVAVTKPALLLGVAPVVLQSEAVVQQGIPVIVCGREHHFRRPDVAAQMMAFSSVVELLSPKNITTFLHPGAPKSARSRDGFILKTFKFVLAEMRDGIFDNVPLSVSRYVTRIQPAICSSAIFGQDLGIHLNKYGFFRALDMHLEGASLPQVAGFLARANLAYKPNPARVKSWLHNRHGLPSDAQVDAWYEEAIEVIHCSGKKFSVWLETGALPTDEMPE